MQSSHQTSLAFPSRAQFPESLEERAKLLGDVQVKDISSLYRMQNVLGAGAQATVYQAVNKKSSRKVAIKVCVPSCLSLIHI